MSTDLDPAIALTAYETLADDYARRIDVKPHNAYYDRPAVLSLLPNLCGKSVLDAGCGPGAYSAALCELGAEVTAVDVSPKMVAHARQRLGAHVEVLQADLAQPLSFADCTFDAVVCPLVLDYLRCWRKVFKEFYRTLKARGVIVFSCENPVSDFHVSSRRCYFAVEQIEMTWRGFGSPVVMPSYRRPISDMLNPLLEAGFLLEQVLEPQPTAAFAKADPDEFRSLCENPGFICFRASKSGSPAY